MHSRVDCQRMEDIITTGPESVELIDVVQAYSRYCSLNENVVRRLKVIVADRAVPGLVAAALTALRNAHIETDEITRQYEYFLNYDIYTSEWYDETISSIGYYKRFATLERKNSLSAAYDKLLRDAKSAEDTDLLEFCNS